MMSTMRLSESHQGTLYSVPWSHAQVLQLQEVDLGGHRHRHDVQSSDEVVYVGYQIDLHEDYNWIK